MRSPWFAGVTPHSAPPSDPTLGELAAEFTGQHVAEAATIASIEFRIRYALDGPKLDEKGGWRDVKIDRLNAAEIGAWRKALPARSGYGIHKALRQVLHYAVRAKLLDENPAALVPNPEPKRVEVPTFTLDELDLVAPELSPLGRVEGRSRCHRGGTANGRPQFVRRDSSTGRPTRSGTRTRACLSPRESRCSSCRG
jgi:hypothetical protein